MCEMQSAEIGELAKSLAKVQAVLKPAAKNATNPFLKNKYADLQSCISALQEILPANGLAYTQMISPSEPGTISVDTLLMHESGQWVKARCTLPCQATANRDGKAAMNAAQAAGSAITYARRYGLSAIVGLVADDDDDGCGYDTPQRKQARETAQVKQTRLTASASNPHPLDDGQRKALMARLNEMGCREREDYLVELSKALGRTVETSKSLTVDEFHRFMQATEPQFPADNDNPF